METHQLQILAIASAIEAIRGEGSLCDGNVECAINRLGFAVQLRERSGIFDLALIGVARAIVEPSGLERQVEVAAAAIQNHLEDIELRDLYADIAEEVGAGVESKGQVPSPFKAFTRDLVDLSAAIAANEPGNTEWPSEPIERARWAARQDVWKAVLRQLSDPVKATGPVLSYTSTDAHSVHTAHFVRNISWLPVDVHMTFLECPARTAPENDQSGRLAQSLYTLTTRLAHLWIGARDAAAPAAGTEASVLHRIEVATWRDAAQLLLPRSVKPTS